MNMDMLAYMYVKHYLNQMQPDLDDTECIDILSAKLNDHNIMLLKDLLASLYGTEVSTKKSWPPSRVPKHTSFMHAPKDVVNNNYEKVGECILTMHPKMVYMNHYMPLDPCIHGNKVYSNTPPPMANPDMLVTCSMVIIFEYVHMLEEVVSALSNVITLKLIKHVFGMSSIIVLFDWWKSITIDELGCTFAWGMACMAIGTNEQFTKNKCWLLLVKGMLDAKGFEKIIDLHVAFFSMHESSPIEMYVQVS